MIDFEASSGAFPASPITPGQPQSRLSWRVLQTAAEKPAWWQDYLAIREAFPHFRNWRIWVYIAWAGQPVGSRTPATLEVFAPTVLGCSSRVVRKWREKTWGENPTMEEAIAWVQAAPLLAHRRDVFDALAAVAKLHDPKAHNDRKMFLEMTGDYRPRGVNSPDDAEQARIGGWLKELREAA
jgi:hypothetical protein